MPLRPAPARSVSRSADIRSGGRIARTRASMGASRRGWRPSTVDATQGRTGDQRPRRRGSRAVDVDVGLVELDHRRAHRPASPESPGRRLVRTDPPSATRSAVAAPDGGAAGEATSTSTCARPRWAATRGRRAGPRRHLADDERADHTGGPVDAAVRSTLSQICDGRPIPSARIGASGWGRRPAGGPGRRGRPEAAPRPKVPRHDLAAMPIRHGTVLTSVPSPGRSTTTASGGRVTGVHHGDGAGIPCEDGIGVPAPDVASDAQAGWTHREVVEGGDGGPTGRRRRRPGARRPTGRRRPTRRHRDRWRGRGRPAPREHQAGPLDRVGQARARRRWPELGRCTCAPVSITTFPRAGRHRPGRR